MVIRVVASGTWRYDGTQPTVVRFVETDFDVWFGIREADGDLAHDERPTLNSDGHVYYLRRPGWELGEPFWPDRVGFMSGDDTKAAAEAELPGPVNWT